MELQKLLEKATPRPLEPCPCGHPECKRFVLKKPLNMEGRLTAFDALLQRHAVNNLEGLVVTGRALMSILEAVDMEEFHEHGKTFLEIAEFCQAIRQAEEVTS